ncbi:MAG: phosphoserine phosphatase SerB [Helicobacteraceae bacterium]|jgi:phosphoserine phosphatase|nr:phosphoserine phosphatase SerB [Helicobacteraceae bacterium]
MKLCVFDFDSTLMDGETIDFLAEDYGVGDRVRAITEAAMRGELDFFEALLKRVELLRGMSAARAREVCESLPLMNGAAECVRELKRLGFCVMILSGGFRLATDFALGKLGADVAFANILHEKDGVLTGLVGGEMLFNFSKGDLLERIQAVLGAGIKDTIAIGDGANDRAMFARADMRIAFCAKETLRREANVIIDQKDLRLVLDAIKKRFAIG